MLMVAMCAFVCGSLSRACLDEKPGVPKWIMAPVALALFVMIAFRLANQ